MHMRQPRYSKEEHARRGDDIYERLVRPHVEAGNLGKIVAIDVDTGAFDLGLTVPRYTNGRAFHLIGEDGTVHTTWRDVGTTYDPCLACRTWRNEPGGPIVVLESSGVYGKPIYHVLLETLEGVGANARAVRQRPGKKTDKAEAAWLAALLAQGRVEPSVIPPPAVQALRALPRTRGALGQTRTQVQNRLSKM